MQFKNNFAFVEKLLKQKKRIKTIAKTFEWGESNHKSHSMRSSEIFER